MIQPSTIQLLILFQLVFSEKSFNLKYFQINKLLFIYYFVVPV